MANEDNTEWNGLLRRDGMSVARTLAGDWVAMSPDKRPTIAVCPCCNKPFRTKEAVIHIVDRLYPLVGEGGHA
jgi:hypothetical protein